MKTVSILALTGLLAAPCMAQTVPDLSGSLSGELRLGWNEQRANPAGPLAAANALVDGFAPPPASSALAQAVLRSRWRAGSSVQLQADALLQSERPEGGPTRSRARFNELNASLDHDAWQFSAGRKIVSWDVGYAWRPNDMVQQEERRQLGPTSLEGRPLLQLDLIPDAERAFTLVWVNPQHQRAADAEPHADESALAARWYQRLGTLDGYLFARAGEHTRGSVGASAAWVADDALELHGALRWSQRHDGWQIDPAAATRAVGRDPWQTATLGRSTQALLGLNWTGSAQQSLIAEWWWDGNAPSDADWSQWNDRNAALQALGAQPLPPAARSGVAGNLAWQSTPLAGPGLRRHNAYLRAAWQPEAWTFAADLLWHPSDAGRAITLSSKWQGDRVSVEAAWRWYGGPAGSLYAQLPSRQTGSLTAVWSF